MNILSYTYLITAIRIKVESEDDDIFQINLFVLNEFVSWLYDEGYIEFDLAYSYRLWIN